MASLIPGYEYDIFISYRQKDNKHDGWVTEFVNNLKGELESTFKEEISVYFDINPHDGLLETHDVGASLKEKLKCLVFIPVISRTYCDPKSFAWDQEFKAFIDQASNDQFGLKVKLLNGNVANRVLPVRIHDLDTADNKLCESLLGGYLRGVEFIYKEPGVNRPLTPNDDEKINLNKTKYRNQINKLGNTISDVISGLTNEYNLKIEKEHTEIQIPVDGTSKTDLSDAAVSEIRETETVIHLSDKLSGGKRKKRIYTSGSLIILLAVIAILIFSSGSSLPFSRRDWIVITDFENLTDNPVFEKSLYTAFSLTINQSKYINVLPRSRMLETLARMRIEDKGFIDDKTGREISLREGCKIFIVPSISKIGNSYVIAAKILETKTGNLLTSEKLNAEYQDDILAALDRLSKKIRRQLGESIYEISTQDKPLSKVTTSSLEALKLYSIGVDNHKKLNFSDAKEYYEKALKIDSGFIAAKASLGSLMIEKFDNIKGRELLNQAVKSINNLTEREKLYILAFHAVNVDKDIAKGIEYVKRRIELYPDDPTARNNLGWYYQNSGRFEEAIKEYKAATRIDPNIVIAYGGLLWIYLEKLGRPDSALVWSEKMIAYNPQNAWGHLYLGSAWLSLDSLVKAERAYERAREINPDLVINLYRLAHTFRLQGKYPEAIEILKKILGINQNEVSACYDLGVNYQSMGNREEAYKYLSEFKKTATKEWVIKWPDDAGTFVAQSAVWARLGEMDSSRLMLQKAIAIDSTLHESFAEVLCLQDNVPEALNQLEKAFKDGYRNLFWLKMTPDLEKLKYDIRYLNLLTKISMIKPIVL